MGMHVCVCMHMHARVHPKAPRGCTTVRSLGDCDLNVQINTFSQVIKVGHLVNLFSARACSQSARSHTRDRLFQLGRRPAFLGEAAFADPPKYARTPGNNVTHARLE